MASINAATGADDRGGLVRHLVRGLQRNRAGTVRQVEVTSLGSARARAPRRLRDVMGPRDTFVRGHIKGAQGVTALDTRLSKYSMLADVIGRQGGP